MEQLFNAPTVINLIIISYYVWLICQFNKYLVDTPIVPATSMKDIVSRDFQFIGCYDDKLKNSLTIWLYSILVVTYLKNPATDIKSVFIVWNDTFNYDPDGIVFDSIEDAWTRFLAVLDKSREFKEEPEFKISEHFDYHNLAKTLMNNDYVNSYELIKAIDILMEGGN